LQGRYWDAYIKGDRQGKVIEFDRRCRGRDRWPRPLFPLHIYYPLSKMKHRGLPHHYSLRNFLPGVTQKVNNHGFEAWSSLVQHAAAKARNLGADI